MMSSGRTLPVMARTVFIQSFPYLESVAMLNGFIRVERRKPQLPTSYIILNADVLTESVHFTLSLSSRVVGVPGIHVSAISKQFKGSVRRRVSSRRTQSS